MATSCEELTHWKDSDAGRDWGQEEKGTSEDEMAGWHHRLDGLESEWTPGVGDGQGGLAWFMGSQRVRHDWATELNWTEGLSWAQQRIGHYTILLEMRKKDDSNETITPFSRSPNSIVLLVLQCLGHFLFTLKKMHLCHICHDQNRLQLNLRQI